MSKKIRWVVTVFHKTGNDSLIVSELHLLRGTESKIRKILKVRDEELLGVCWPIPVESMGQVESLTAVRLIPEKYEYFIEASECN